MYTFAGSSSFVPVDSASVAYVQEVAPVASVAAALLKEEASRGVVSPLAAIPLLRESYNDRALQKLTQTGSCLLSSTLCENFTYTRFVRTSIFLCVDVRVYVRVNLYEQLERRAETNESVDLSALSLCT